MYKNILIATDGTELGGKALRHGLALAKSVGASVVVVTVTELWPPLEMAQQVQSEGTQAIEDYGRWAANYATAVLTDASDVAGEANVACETQHIKNSHPSDGILRAASDADCDLIVMSTHGRSGINRMVLGSEAMEVLTHTTIPVLIVR